MVSKIAGIGIGSVAVLGAIAFFIFSRKPEDVPTIEEYQEGKSVVAEARGKEGVKDYCSAKWGSNETMVQACINREHDKMLYSIANHDFSGCVTAYKRSHEIPMEGWQRTPHDYCATAISAMVQHKDPVVNEIIKQGTEVYGSGEAESARTRETVHPGAYAWITANTDCKSSKDANYRNWEIAWQDAMINGWGDPRHTKEQFKDKVYEYAGISTRKWKVWTPFGSF